MSSKFNQIRNTIGTLEHSTQDNTLFSPNGNFENSTSWITSSKNVLISVTSLPRNTLINFPKQRQRNCLGLWHLFLVLLQRFWFSWPLSIQNCSLGLKLQRIGLFCFIWLFSEPFWLWVEAWYRRTILFSNQKPCSLKLSSILIIAQTIGKANYILNRYILSIAALNVLGETGV